MENQPIYAEIYKITVKYEGEGKEFQVADKTLSGVLKTLSEDQCLGKLNPEEITLTIKKDSKSFPILRISEKLKR